MGCTDSEYERWLVALTLDDVRGLFKENGAVDLLCKVLPRNANSKNQVYLAPDIGQLGKIPSGPISPFQSSSRKGSGDHGPIFRAPLSLFWITRSGEPEPAPDAKLIIYPQYPEVRLSGFLARCREAPSFLFNIEKRGHDPDRLLFLGPREDGSVLAFALPPEGAAAKEFRQDTYDEYGTFAILSLHADGAAAGLNVLMAELLRIHKLGWVPSLRLNKSGILVPCNATNCGGYTLEAQLGIRSNGIAEPDFRGWEIKSRNVVSIEQPRASIVTLFTPEPDGGVYASDGPDHFIRTWGYPDTRGRADRINFGGIYRCGKNYDDRTHIKLVLDGYDPTTGKFDADGALQLIDDKGVLAASWSFAKLMDHWKRKHAHAAYVPCQPGKQVGRTYRYADAVMLGEGAEFRLFLKAIADGAVYYDPGIKLEDASTVAAKHKLRSQMRVSSLGLSQIYRATRLMRLDGAHR